MSNIKIGICGIGFVGNAMMTSFINKGYILNQTLFVYDKYKENGIGTFEDLLQTDILFLSLPTIFDYDTLIYDKGPIVETLASLKNNSYGGVVIIKSTVEPQTTEKYAIEYQLNLIHNPEFLTARTAYEDFHNQKHIVLGKSSICTESVVKLTDEFYKTNYPNATLSLCTSDESETMKIFANTFYASKVQIFTEFYLLCQKINVNFNNVKDIMIKNGWINPMHTTIPGPDGKISYGGLCFPKDTTALLHFMKTNESECSVIEAVIKERENMRDDNHNTTKK